MGKITLVKNGVFPIVKDKNGNLIENLPDTGLPIAGTIQGEGKTAGVPCLFIRTSGCNLRCAWEMEDGTVSICDTPYSSHNAVEFDEWEVSDVLETVKQNIGNMEHVVISGGEPTRQHEALAELTGGLIEMGLYVTIETNGTLFDENWADNVDLFSISPKLQDSIPTVEKMKKLGMEIESDRAIKQTLLRKNIQVLQRMIDHANDIGSEFQLKFVITRPENVEEIKNDFLEHLTGWAPSDIYLMPVGANPEELLKSSRMTAKIAIENGWNYTPRLQVDLFGNKPGV